MIKPEGRPVPRCNTGRKRLHCGKKMRIRNLFILAVALVCGASCGVKNRLYNNPPGIEMSVYPSVYDSPPRRVELSITNHTQESAHYGASYMVQKLVDGEWIRFELPDFAVIAIMYLLEPGGTQVYQIDLYSDDIEYTPGRYRIVKPIHLEISGEGTYTGEFEIK